MAIETQVPTLTTAKLMFKVENGTEIEATRDMLREMGFFHKEDLYERTRHMFGIVNLDIESDEDNVSLLRYFIEYITQGYTWDPDEWDLNRMREQFGGP